MLSDMCWFVEVVMHGTRVAMLAFLVTMTVSICIVVLMVSLMFLLTLVVMELIFKQFWMFNEVIVDKVIALRSVKRVDHFLL